MNIQGKIYNSSNNTELDQGTSQLLKKKGKLVKDQVMKKIKID